MRIPRGQVAGGAYRDREVRDGLEDPEDLEDPVVLKVQYTEVCGFDYHQVLVTLEHLQPASLAHDAWAFALDSEEEEGIQGVAWDSPEEEDGWDDA